MIDGTTQRAHGWRPEPEGHVWAKTHHDLIGAAAPMQDTPSLYRFRGSKLWQSSAECCVGAWFTRCCQLLWAAHGVGTDIRISMQAAYILAQLWEHAGEDPESIQIVDVGCIPAFLLEAGKQRGVVLEEDLPLNLATISTPDVVTPAMLMRGYDMRGMDYAPIPTGPGIIDAMADGLKRFQAPGIAIGVSAEFANYAGDGVIQTLDPNGPGHMLGILEVDYDNERVRPDNWWTDVPTGNFWGLPDGTGWISFKAIESAGVKAAYLVKAEPKLVRKVA